MRVTSAAKVGFAAVVIVLVLIAIFRGLGWTVPGFGGNKASQYKLYVSFESVKGLNKGAGVQLNGNSIGEVGEITNDEFGGVLIELLIHTRQPIHEHAKFIIARESIFGSYLVSIDESRAGYMTSDVANGEFTVRVATGQLEKDGLVIKAGVTIGTVVSVAPFPVKKPTGAIEYDIQTDQVVVKLDQDVVLDKSMAFVPKRPAVGAPMGFEVFNVIPPDTKLSGKREAGPEQLVADADTALNEIHAQTMGIMAELTHLLDKVDKLLDPEDVKNLLDSLAGEATAIAGNIKSLTDRLNYILAETQPNIIGAAENVSTMTTEASTLMQDMSEYNTPEMRENIKSIVANLNEASDKLVTILDDIQGYTSDEQLKGDIKGTISEARTTIEEARGTLQSAETTLQEMSSGMSIFGGIQTGGEFTLRNAPEPDRWSGDLNFRLGLESSDVFVVAGIDDIGENDRANAQMGWLINDATSARAGVHRGKLGIGLDWRSEAFRVTNDVYDPNALRWDIYAGYAVIPELDLVVGVEDLLDTDELNLGMAFRF